MKYRFPLYYCLLSFGSCMAEEALSTLKVVSVVRHQQHDVDSQQAEEPSPTLVSRQAKPTKYASIGQTFCKPSQDHIIQNDTLVCKQLDGEQGRNNTTEYHEYRRRLLLEKLIQPPMSCGPNCRPSCLTLLLDLEKYPTSTSACEDSSCPRTCQVVRNAQPCRTNEENYALEEVKCLGPIVYDDNVSFMQKHTNYSGRLPKSCSYLPEDDDPHYDRFRGWPVVHPMDVDCEGSCFSDPTKLYFEYCNVIHEDPMCDACGTSDCGTECSRHVAPFSDGWTSFVVSASIPIDEANCKLQHADTGKACWTQRIDAFFPAESSYCHECPLISLGDRFGPLEVVGFGHGIGQACAPCDGAVMQGGYPLNCNELQQCQQLGDCPSGESHNLPSFIENKCSWQKSDASFVEEDGLDRENIFTVEYDPRNEVVKGPDNAASGDQQPSEKFSSLQEKIIGMLPLIVPIGLVVFSMLLMSLTLRRNRKRAAVVSLHEEIQYRKNQRIKEDKAIARFLSDSEDGSSELETTSNMQDGNDDTVQSNNGDNGVKSNKGVKELHCKPVRHNTKRNFVSKAIEFRTASLIHQQGIDEVEVLETSGTHHVNVRWV